MANYLNVGKLHIKVIFYPRNKRLPEEISFYVNQKYTLHIEIVEIRQRGSLCPHCNPYYCSLVVQYNGSQMVPKA